MASKLYGVAVNVIRNRGHQDIMPGAVFSAESAEATKEYWRLERNGALREATDDEVKLYEAKVADGETPNLVLGATAEEYAALNESFTGSVNTGGAADSTVTKTNNDGSGDGGDGKKPADEKKTAAPAAAAVKAGAKKDDDI